MPSMHTLRPTASRLKSLAENKPLLTAYRQVVEDLFAVDVVENLATCRHHKGSRLQHSLNVSYYSFMLAKLLKMDAEAVARAGLLHDLFHYDFRDTDISAQEHVYEHPKRALSNARMLCELSAVEEDIILNHMWPTCPQKGLHHKETYLVAIVDKYCACIELVHVFAQYSTCQTKKACNLVMSIF